MLTSVLKSIINIKVIKLFLLKYKFKGKSILIKSEFVNLNTVINNFSTIMEGSVTDRLVNIGEYSYIGKYCYLTRVKIGNYCSIANNVSIGQGEHDLDRISTNSIFYNDAYNELTKKECEIGNDVWIGVDSIVKRGVKIHNGAVVGANSIVTKDVPPYAIVVGNPAKIIRYRFTDSKIKSIEDSNWWTTPPLEAKDIFAELETK